MFREHVYAKSDKGRELILSSLIRKVVIPIAKSRRSQSRSKKKKSSLKNKLINVLLALMLIVGLALVFNNQIKNQIVKWMSNKNRIEHLSRKDIESNMEKDVSFDFDAVESLDFETVVKSRVYQDQLYVVGGIAIPDIGLNLPIYKGLSNYALSAGAGTMKDGQQMGEGNYALASHNMNDGSLLFAPLSNIPAPETKETLMYLTDLEYIYTYKVTMKKYVDPSQSQVIDDVEGKKMLTLVTCDFSGAERLIIQGEFVNKVSGKKATTAMTNAFNLETNTFK
ncbi:class A sortase [uncultured Vagococcus sp.]|uniref:class A sortase n=1 Tax=uncultured Vagococcus sp. TaxID=189676 RepID=UPI0028D3D4C8|nr:class A sortase [uncultured Vagococcus sp.]